MEAFTRRSGPANALAGDAEAIAAACHAMAERFHRGGRLVVFGSGGPGGSSSDAAHVVVEFVHPVIVGKKALPAFALTGPNLAAQLALLAEPADIALGISAGVADAELTEAIRAARRAGLLTVALLGGDGDPAAREGIAGGGLAEHTLVVRSDDPLVVKEVQVTTYHVLWELVHVFAEQPGALA